MRRRRRNPERAYFVRDGYTRHMEEFSNLRTAIKYAMRVGDFVSADDVIKHIYVERDERYIPLSQASRATAKIVAEYANRNPMKRRRTKPSYTKRIAAERRRDVKAWSKRMAGNKWAKLNPGHPSYAQHLMRLGLHHGDPIIELASVWASGQDAGTRLIKQALTSAEHWRESKDKRLRQAMGSVVNKLTDYLGHAEGREARRAPRSTRTIHPAWRNPKRDGSPTRGEARAARRSGSVGRSTSSASEGSFNAEALNGRDTRIKWPGQWEVYASSLAYNAYSGGVAQGKEYRVRGDGGLSPAALGQHAAKVEAHAARQDASRFFEMYQVVRSGGVWKITMEFGS
jgi:hypothetical protein